MTHDVVSGAQIASLAPISIFEVVGLKPLQYLHPLIEDTVRSSVIKRRK